MRFAANAKSWNRAVIATRLQPESAKPTLRPGRLRLATRGVLDCPPSIAVEKEERRARWRINSANIAPRRIFYDATEGEDYPGSRRGDRVRLADVASYNTFSGP